MAKVASSAYSTIGMRFSTPAVQLTMDSDTCTGCIAKDADGYFRLKAAKGVILATGGGLTIDGNAQVVSENAELIGNLYAVGNASGNFFAGNYPRHIPGTSIGRAITLGYVAAEHAVKGA